MRQKDHITKIYSQYWIKAAQKYAETNYINCFIPLLLGMLNREEFQSRSALEVAIGTGFPVAYEIRRAGFFVTGVDLSFDLIKVCRVNGVVGDAEDLPIRSDTFAITYCLQSTWYFPSLTKALHEMHRITAPGGYIVFDLMNRHSPRIIWHCLRNKLLKRIVFLLFNIKRVILRQDLLDIFYHDPEIPASPRSVRAVLDARCCSCQTLLPKDIDKVQNGMFKKRNRFLVGLSPRQIFVCRKVLRT